MIDQQAKKVSFLLKSGIDQGFPALLAFLAYLAKVGLAATIFSIHIFQGSA
jgi:hypothetical protein